MRPIRKTQVTFITHISLLSIFVLAESLTVLQGETFPASVEQLAGVGFGHKWYHWKGISRAQLDPVNARYDLHSD